MTRLEQATKNFLANPKDVLAKEAVRKELLLAMQDKRTIIVNV